MKKILVADDEPDVERLISQIFRARIKKGELSFVFAENGAVALEKLQTDPSIDLIFTDINMPVMDGLELLSKIKENNFIQKAVVISAYGDLKNIRTAMNRGAFDFVTKPIDFDDLTTTLLKAISEMEILRQGIEAKSNLEKALIEKAEAQQQALTSLQEKEKLILYQNELLEQQVKERTSEINLQKQLIEVKNKDILDSIHYAKRLQQAILPSSEKIKKYLPESFILYQPKDIVSGDFYWVGNAGDLAIIVAADCTGHGVAGALMSMIGISLLNQIVNEKGITTPSLILDQLHSSVIAALKQTENDSHHAMDIAVCCFDLSGANLNKEKSEIQFAGANRPLWVIRNNELETIRPDKIPIGGLYAERNKSFLNTVQLTVNDTLYLFTDGYADQFGGEKGKKLMSKTFKEILLSIQKMNMGEQEVFLKNYFEKWKGDNEQVDDILVIGIRV
ncbi:MAG TPA: response regulator [Bacteroidia bacterium]|nr:response regulator [Bacteroidia bacterium]